MADAEPRSKPEITPERIAERAYELYCEGGFEDGHDLDSLQAEGELAEASVRTRESPDRGASE